MPDETVNYLIERLRFLNPDLMNKSWEVHLYCTLTPCGKYGPVAKKRCCPGTLKKGETKRKQKARGRH